MNLLSIAQQAVSEAVKIAETFLDDAKVISSGGKDIKTLADQKMNDCIVKHLQSTNIPIISEEIENDLSGLPAECWIIDPLDGTFNFSRKYPCAGISICLWQDGKPVIGVVKDIFSKQTYSCSSGESAWLDKKKMSVSSIDKISNAVLITGFPSGGSYQTEDLMLFVRNVQQFKKIRAIGAASLMLSHVANGIFDVYYEKDIYIWDVAAGLALVKRAGGKYFMRRNGTTNKYEILASNALLFDSAKNILVNGSTINE